MSSSLISEQHIVVPVSLAATLGLEEAVLLQVLAECQRHREPEAGNGAGWIAVNADELRRLVPFFSDDTIDRVSRNLQAQGVIELDHPSFAIAREFRFAMHDPASTARPRPSERPAPAKQPWRERAPRGATPIPDQWLPRPEVFDKLAEYHGVDEDFARNLVPEFVTYWRDRKGVTWSWEAKFMRHAVAAWQRCRAEQSAADNSRIGEPGDASAAMTADWRPSADAVEILVRSGVDAEFIDDAVAEFVLYWRERGEVTSTWNSRFIAHIRRQWARYTASLANESEPQVIGADWQPCADVFDILAMANIDADFAVERVPEFVLYWREAGQAHTAWNSRFLRHIKQQWSRRLSGETIPDHERRYPHQSPAGPDRRGFVEKHTDNSWAKDL